MNLDNYLKRISYTGEVSPCLSVLKKVHRHHLLTIPFENLDIHYDLKIELDTNKIFDKVVQNNRGGFCYELNGLFNELLQEIGFRTSIVYALVYNKENDYFYPPYDHMAIMVHLKDQDYLVDVGFGDFVTEPLPIVLDTELIDPSGIYKIEIFDKKHLLISKNKASGFIPVYAFSTTAEQLQSFQGRCDFNQTAPESHFTQKKVCSILTENGRISLSDNFLKITESGLMNETAIKNDLEFLYFLKKYFNIDGSILAHH